MKMNNNLKLFIIHILHAILVLCILFFSIACQRENMYDIASGKSRTAYAIAYDGLDYTLIIANVYYVKTYKITPSFTAPPAGLSVSKKGNIIVFDASSTILIQHDLQTWATITSTPMSSNVIGFNNSFICFNTSDNYIYQLSENYTWIQTIGSFSSNSLGFFKGNNSEVYVVEPNGTDINIYSIQNPVVPIFTAALGISLANPFGGFKTKNYFYLWYANTTNSIFRITPSNTITLNPISYIGNSLVDLTVTDDDQVFAIVSETGLYQLKQIISDGNYPVLRSFGSTGAFKIDSLDDSHLVIASSDNTDGYNGLFIYNLSENTIEKNITSQNIIAMHVPRF